MIAAAQPLTTAPGTYLLWLHAERAGRVLVGRLGELRFDAGWLGYCGSAFGPGGLRARVARHRRDEKALRWHIDYLRASLPLVGVWFTTDPKPREHQWAATVLALGGRAALTGFGSSDCRCPAHLFQFARRPRLARFRGLLARRVEAHAPVAELCWR